MKRWVGAAMALLAAALFPSAASAQAANPNVPLGAIEDMSLEDLLNMETHVASRTSSSVVDAPGVLTVVTREEMLALGARDLIDVLHMVAGFSFAQDVESVTDAGFRGVWGHEGKILLLLDGQELNEPLYSTLQMGHHFLLHNVDRIEIIRGPGSVVYGGHAELAVVNIMSRAAATMEPISLQLNYAETTHDFAHRSVQLAGGHVFESVGLALTAAASWGQANRADALFSDFNGNPPYRGNQVNAGMDPLTFNLSADWRDLHVRLLYDNYHVNDRYPYDSIIPAAMTLQFITIAADVRYDWKILPSLTVTPRLNYKRQLPWYDALATTANYASDFFAQRVDRTYATVTASWDVQPGLNLLAGAQATLDLAHIDALPPPDLQSGVNTVFDNGRTTVAYENYAAFAQVLWNSPWVNITAGARYENHSFFGSSFVPRIGLTKSYEGFHFKALLSEAFRAPGIENIHLNGRIRPERTLALEVELGYVMLENMYVGLNVYDLTIRDPIIYNTSNNQEIYDNFPQTGSRGLEVEWRYRGPLGFANVNYSLAAAAGKNQVPAFQVPQHPQAVLGLPMHKATVGVGARVGEHWVIGPSVVVLGPRYGTLFEPGVIVPTAVTTLVNVLVTYHNLGLDGLDVSLGAYNILGEDFTYIQPYNSYQAEVSPGRKPIPGLSRQVLARVTWAWQ